MSINYQGRIFRSTHNTPNGEVGGDTRFHYFQESDVVTGTYSGGGIKGQLMAKVLPDGSLDVRYHHLNAQGEFMLGQCFSKPEILPDGRIRLYEEWQWLSGDGSKGHSVVEEVE
jgi:hypothetical protein